MKLAIVGAGKMGGAVLTGALSTGVLGKDELGIYHPDAQRLKLLADEHRVAALGDDELHHAERVLIAVKPQSFAEVAPLVAHRNASYISIMAGVTADAVAKRVGSNRIVRAMPNLGASVGLSATALAHLPQTTGEDVEFAERLFGAVGTVHHVPERLFDAFTGLAGSGPAFAAVFAEALADGGVRVGFDRQTSYELVRQVLLATATLLQERLPAQLKDEVSSAGGTGIAGVRALERYGLRYATLQAVEEATVRAAELSKQES